ncbi:TIGR02996 domain-containing protein [Gemmata sp. G18]|uniref:TIGR02996 domain-containing protein n=1 Tax=Gemmata palustris TaxID=2822762 RepID=A0ABS5C1I1_9BACT|nr:TIGR02996 domain-containing protein [Gemmata palustris]MBP3959852.1 TIGR02996 domain-containing protein [Gemmata palustris]
MTDDERAFIRAAIAEPDEDTIRLAYADWLDEQGDAVTASHAEFVRLQVRRSRLDAFDPERATLLEQEAACLRKHKRDWNGRVHRYLTRAKFPGKVDARHGLVRGWNYHRGMIARATVTAEALTTHPDLMFALGPVAHLRLAAWPVTDWEPRVARQLAEPLSRLKVVSFAGVNWTHPPLSVASLEPFARVPLLDLRAVTIDRLTSELLALARAGAISPVVLYRNNVHTTRTQRVGRREYQVQDARLEAHVIDPHGKWDALRLEFADLTGEVLSPIPHQGTRR